MAVIPNSAQVRPRDGDELAPKRRIGLNALREYQTDETRCCPKVVWCCAPAAAVVTAQGRADGASPESAAHRAVSTAQKRASMCWVPSDWKHCPRPAPATMASAPHAGDSIGSIRSPVSNLRNGLARRTDASTSNGVVDRCAVNRPGSRLVAWPKPRQRKHRALEPSGICRDWLRC